MQILCVAAAGVAAHEAGHALQDAENYFPMKIRSGIVPLVQLGSNLGPWLFLAGYFLGIIQLAWVGLILFAFSSIFALGDANTSLSRCLGLKRRKAASGQMPNSAHKNTSSGLTQLVTKEQNFRNDRTKNSLILLILL